MIHFFRKIRQNLLSKGNIGKYLKYAFGEIVLVVIGILIALQINNLNEFRKERRVEFNTLNEILANLDDDLKNLDLKINETNIFLTHSSKVLEHLQNGTPLTDSLMYHYSALIGHGNFEPTRIAYEKLSTIGIDIIQNKNLRQAISELYTVKYFVFVEDRRTVVRRFQENQVVLVQNKIKLYENYKKAEPIDLGALRNDIPFQNMLITNVWILNWVIERYEKGAEEIKSVQRLINEELKT